MSKTYNVSTYLIDVEISTLKKTIKKIKET